MPPHQRTLQQTDIPIVTSLGPCKIAVKEWKPDLPNVDYNLSIHTILPPSNFSHMICHYLPLITHKLYNEPQVARKTFTHNSNIFSMPCLFSRAVDVSVHWSILSICDRTAWKLLSVSLYPQLLLLETLVHFMMMFEVWMVQSEHVSFEIFTVPNWVRQQGTFCMNTGYLLRVPLVLLLIPYLKPEACDVPDRTGCYEDDYSFTGDWDCRCQTKHQIHFSHKGL